MKIRKHRKYFWPEEMTDSSIACSLRRVKSLKWVINNCKEKGVAVQAGGSYGVWPKILSKHFKTVYSFEPEPKSFCLLCMNVSEENVIKLQMALGHGRNLVGVNKRSDASHRVAKEGVIPMMKIDDLRLPQCDAILLDIEGFEYYALSGGVKTIMDCHPMILVESIKDDINYFGVQKNQVHNFIIELGYKMVKPKGIGKADHIYVPI